MKPLLTLLLLLPTLLLADATMLAKKHRNDIDVRDYFVSEKLDGIRARWTGHQLLSRNGNIIHAPQWFTEGFPTQLIDGELWTGRDQFQVVSKVVLDDKPDETGWQKVRYMIFDLPGHTGPFSQRVLAMQRLVEATANQRLQMIAQIRLDSQKTLMAKLREVETLGGEGLMLQHADNLYSDGRSDGLLKLKSHADAEATVIGHTRGKGRFTGMVGALVVRSANGLEFRLGSGLDLQDRQSPPPIGAIVTYRHFGFTQSGKPRFASFLRQRDSKTVGDQEPEWETQNIGGSPTLPH